MGGETDSTMLRRLPVVVSLRDSGVGSGVFDVAHSLCVDLGPIPVVAGEDEDEDDDDSSGAAPAAVVVVVAATTPTFSGLPNALRRRPRMERLGLVKEVTEAAAAAVSWGTGGVPPPT